MRNALQAFKVYAQKQRTPSKRQEASAIAVIVRHMAGSIGSHSVIEDGIRHLMAPGDETRVAVNASDTRFYPSKWGMVSPGYEWESFERRLPGLLGLREPSPLIKKHWSMSSSTEALRLNPPDV